MRSFAVPAVAAGIGGAGCITANEALALLLLPKMKVFKFP